MSGATSARPDVALVPHAGATLRRLGDLEPITLALMHGPSYQGDGRDQLYRLAAGYEELAAAPNGTSPA